MTSTQLPFDPDRTSGKGQRVAFARPRVLPNESGDLALLTGVVVAVLFFTWPGFFMQTTTSGPWVIDNVLGYFRERTLRSYVFYYPMLQGNALAAAILAWGTAGVALGAWTWTQFSAWFIDPFQFMAIAKTVSFLFGAGAIFATYWLGRRIVDRSTGILAAIILAFSPTFTRYCHEPVPETAMTCMAGFATVFLIAILQQPSVQNYTMAGLLLGLACAAKYNAAVLSVVLLIVHTYVWRRNRISRVPLIDHNLARAFVAGSLAFAITSFQVLLQPRQFLWTLFVFHEDTSRYGGLSYGFVPWLSHLQTILNDERGVAVLFLCGVVFALHRRSTAVLTLLLPVLLAWIYMGRWQKCPARYYLFVYPALAVLAAMAALRARDWFATKLPVQLRIMSQTPVVAALALSLWSVVSSAVPCQNRGAPDTRELALRWIETHIPSGAIIAGPNVPEGYPPLISSSKVKHYLTVLPARDRASIMRIIESRPNYKLQPLSFMHATPQLPENWPADVRQQYQQNVYTSMMAREDISLDELRNRRAQYIVTSSYWSSIYQRPLDAAALPQYHVLSITFNRFRSFYSQLASIRLNEERDGIRLIAEFSAARNSAIGPQIRIYRVEH
jgi:hypothetical protein